MARSLMITIVYTVLYMYPRGPGPASARHLAMLWSVALPRMRMPSRILQTLKVPAQVQTTHLDIVLAIFSAKIKSLIRNF
jgi:hypothetical protein